jgi:hypothetical protein
LAAVRSRQAELEQELEAHREGIAGREKDTKDQRRRIAREFKQQRAEHLAELERRKAELLALSTGRDSDLQQQLIQARDTIEQLRREIAELETRPAAASGDAKQQAQLRQERDALADRLEAAEAKLSERAKQEDAGGKSLDDLRRRYELAVEDVRELKRTNAELEQKLKSRGGAPAIVSGGSLDWEAQKQRLLASLEADDDSEEAVAERTTIENTIRITDEIVAQKDREIAELRKRLEAGAGDSHTAIAELLDADEVIRQEREKLSQMQAEWREKIGQAEIDISVERAKIARDRMLLEEKARQFELDQESRTGGESSAADPSKPARGRWLARLGLKDIDESK